MQDQHGLLFLGQRSDGLADKFSCLVLFPSGLGIVRVRCHKGLFTPALVFEPAMEFPPPAEFPVIPIEVPAAVDGDSVNPGGDKAIVPEFSGRLINLEKHFLGDVLAILRVVEQTGTQAKDFILKTIDEHFEGAEVFFCDSPQQFPVVYRLRNLDFGTPLNQMQKAVLFYYRHRGYKKPSPGFFPEFYAVKGLSKFDTRIWIIYDNMFIFQYRIK